MALEFYLESRDALDAKHAEMIGFGYPEHCAPYDVKAESPTPTGR